MTEGLYHEDEPYGNLPEDGYYTVNSTDYNSLEQIEELVRSVYAEDAAEQTFDKREVKIGLSDGINIELTEGVTADDKVRGAKEDKKK